MTYRLNEQAHALKHLENELNYFKERAKILKDQSKGGNMIQQLVEIREFRIEYHKDFRENAG
jgi:hypothetical protein